MFGLFKQLKQLTSFIPTALKYVKSAKIVLHYASLAKKDIETLFDDIEGNEPEYLNDEISK